MPLPPQIKGWCPSTSRPMLSGDGFLLRITIESSISPTLFKRLGELAREFGNGLVDLTQRGNLQIRGVSEHHIRALQQELSHLDLSRRDVEDGPQIIGGALAGFDRHAPQKIDGLIDELRAALEAANLPLPPKFCFLVDDGGFLSLDSVVADIRLIGVTDGFILAIGGKDLTGLTCVPREKAVAATVSIAALFVQQAPLFNARRMSDLSNAIGPTAIANMAGFTDERPLPFRPFKPRHMNGQHDIFLGVGAPYGRLDNVQMNRIADSTANDILITPWRSLLLSQMKPDGAQDLQSSGLIVEADDPRLHIVACPGKSACASGEIDTHALADLLAPFLAPSMNVHAGDSVLLHVSGCKKGCAYGGAVPLTLVGESGAINHVDNARADATPATAGLGPLQAQAIAARLFSGPQHAKVGS